MPRLMIIKLVKYVIAGGFQVTSQCRCQLETIPMPFSLLVQFVVQVPFFPFCASFCLSRNNVSTFSQKKIRKCRFQHQRTQSITFGSSLCCNRTKEMLLKTTKWKGAALP